MQLLMLSTDRGEPLVSAGAPLSAGTPLVEEHQ